LYRYERIVTVQSEMKYTPPLQRLKEWREQGLLLPNPVSTCAKGDYLFSLSSPPSLSPLSSFILLTET